MQIEGNSRPVSATHGEAATDSDTSVGAKSYDLVVLASKSVHLSCLSTAPHGNRGYRQRNTSGGDEEAVIRQRFEVVCPYHKCVTGTV